MRVWQGARTLCECVLDFVAPPTCWACRGAIPRAADHLCESCWAAILSGARAPARCLRCGCPAPAPLVSCLNCVGWGPPWGGLEPGADEREGAAQTGINCPEGAAAPHPAGPGGGRGTAGAGTEGISDTDGAGDDTDGLGYDAAAAEPMAFERAVVLGPFDPPMQRAIHALKFRGCRSLAHLMGQRLGEELAVTLAPVRVVVPVPLHAARQRERGYNQSALIAAGLATALGLPVAGGLLGRVANTPQQARLGRAPRRRNLQAAFQTRGPVPAGGCVAVVDDVMTTGSTLDACARRLLEAGAERVWAVVLSSRFRTEALAWRLGESRPLDPTPAGA